MAKSYTLPKGPFVHAAGSSGAQELTLENIDRVFAKLPKSAVADYLAAGLIAEVPAEVVRELSKPQAAAEPPAKE